MTSRAIALVVVLAGAGCLNTSQPGSRRAVLDQPGPLPTPPAATAAAAPPSAASVEVTALPAPSAPANAAALPRPVDRAEVEMLPVPGSKLSRGRATVMVRAALEKVHAVLVDFSAYPEFMPHYKSAEVEKKTDDGRLTVMMKIDALSGMIQRWMRVEVSPPVDDGARQTFGARLLAGDVKQFEARWVLDRVADGTRLTCESFLDAGLQLPAAFIDAGSAAGIKASILAIKARAER
jgi:ribosome-associated toxin RatA of RatAB toxin-antitoxin module